MPPADSMRTSRCSGMNSGWRAFSHITLRRAIEAPRRPTAAFVHSRDCHSLGIPARQRPDPFLTRKDGGREDSQCRNKIEAHRRHVWLPSHCHAYHIFVSSPDSTILSCEAALCERRALRKCVGRDHPRHQQGQRWLAPPNRRPLGAMVGTAFAHKAR